MLLSGDGKSLIYATCVLGNRPGSAEVMKVAADGIGGNYLLGYTTSAQFPVTSGTFDTTFKADRSNFIMKLDDVKGETKYATFFKGGPSTGWRPTARDLLT